MIILLAAIVSLGVYYKRHTKQLAITRLNELSNHDSGSTLEDFTESLQQSMPNYEIIAVFDSSGNKLIEYTNFAPVTVSLPNEAIKLLKDFKHLTHVHNHPVDNAGHADRDLSMPSRIGLDRAITSLIVVSKNYTYHMECNHKKWPRKEEVIGYFTMLIYLYGPLENIGYIDTIIYDGEIQATLTNKALLGFANDFGYTFYVKDASGNKIFPE